MKIGTPNIQGNSVSRIKGFSRMQLIQIIIGKLLSANTVSHLSSFKTQAPVYFQKQTTFKIADELCEQRLQSNIRVSQTKL